MTSNYDFNDLFVFEMANNHQGDVEHGQHIIKQMGKLAKQYGIKAAVKLQFRHLETFIHPAYREGTSNKHIPRFLSTALSKEQFACLVETIRAEGLVPMCTPFDEASVDLIEELDIDIIKIGSCSAKDWPLLERVSEAGRPVIYSTGGLSIEDIDNLVSFFDHRGVDYAIMHCVALYPTPTEKYQLNQIDLLRDRYPRKTIGWSTHEDPNDVTSIQIAYAKGARMFEKHVGFATDKIKLNAYSADPGQIGLWLESYQRARTMCGEIERPQAEQVELDALQSLERGVYLRKAVKAGHELKRDHVYFAMPRQPGQLSSGKWREHIVMKAAGVADEPVKPENIIYPNPPTYHTLQKAVHEVKALLNRARVYLGSEFKVEYSHHYGMEKFFETGCVLIDCVNREYCKKVIVQLAGQKHPLHYHKRKEETFQVLYGQMHTETDGHHRILGPGDTLLVLPGVWHRFWTETGCVVEEISTTHFNNDSRYQDPKINKMARHQRKTTVDHWGRFQLADIANKSQDENDDSAVSAPIGSVYVLDGDASQQAKSGNTRK